MRDEIDKTVGELEDTVKEVTETPRAILWVIWAWCKVILSSAVMAVARVLVLAIGSLWWIIALGCMAIRRSK